MKKSKRIHSLNLSKAVVLKQQSSANIQRGPQDDVTVFKLIYYY